MTYLFFLAGFSGMGLALLAWLVVGDELEARQSSRDLARMKAAVKDFGTEGLEIAEELRRRIRTGVVEEQDALLEIVQLFLQDSVKEHLKECEFPVGAYSRADQETRQSVRQLMVMLRSEREAGKARVSSPDLKERAKDRLKSGLGRSD